MKKEKRGRESKILKVLKLSGKRTITGQNSGMVKGGRTLVFISIKCGNRKEECPPFTILLGITLQNLPKEGFLILEEKSLR